jgi:hypothetical protein
MKCGKVILFSTLSALLAGLLMAGNAFGQGQSPEQIFGQNRVQYKDFVWSYYQSERFAVYYYLGGQDLGKFTIVDAEREMTDIEKKLEFKMVDRIEIMVYNNLDDLKQSNIGYGIDLNNTGGVTKIIGNKMFIYFNGNHRHLRKQIREGIAGIFLSNMLYGGSLGEAVQNAVLLKLPAWFKEGLTSYVGESWSTENDNLLSNGILSGKYKKLNKLTGADARFAGHAVWHYIAVKYGEPSIPNLLYLTRINRSMESGFSFVFGKTSKEFLSEFYDYYWNQFTADQKNRQMPDERSLIELKQRPQQVIHEVRINDDASALVFIKNKLGRFRVCYRDLENVKSKTIFRGGFKNITQPIDYLQPQMAFSPGGNEVTIMYQRRNKTRVVNVDIKKFKKEKDDIVSFQKVFGFSYVDANSIVLSAENKGQSDIYIYNLRSGKLEQITNDYYDDLNPVFVKLPARQGILFTSNRTGDTLRTLNADTTRPIGNFNLFFYNTKKKSKSLLRVTNSGFAEESYPSTFDKKDFSFLSDYNGINNRFSGHIDSLLDHYDRYFYFADSTVINPAYNIDSLIEARALTPDSVLQFPVYRDTAILSPVTNYAYSILEQDGAVRGKKMAQLMYAKGKYQISIVKAALDSGETMALPLTEYARETYARLEPEKTIRIEAPANEFRPTKLNDTLRADTVSNDNFYFQSDFLFAPSKVLPEAAAQEKKNPPFRFSRILPYSVKFSTSSIVTQIDNSLIVTRYQPFGAYGGQFDNPDFNVFISANMTDLMEDYRIQGGFRFPTQFDGTEYFLTYENLKRRLDKRFTVYRKSVSLSYDYTPTWYLPVNAKVRTYVADATFRYPLDLLRSIRGSFTFRNDRTNYLATDSFSLGLPENNSEWLSVRLEYVFDNTMKIQTNIYDGLRYKVYGDVQRQLDKQKTYLFAAGFDARYYYKISRNFIWASRFTGATSWGDQKVVYYMGAAENEFLPSFNTETPVDLSAGYAFQTLATSMRGFQQNIRNGNSFALVNTELRFPIFSYLLNTPIRSDFVKNFQFVGFFDAGTAWQGISPYDEDNPFNSIDITQGPISVHINYFREPIVYGYGLGARTTILGYFLRLDYARGIDSGSKLKPRWHFSMGLDF